MKANLAILLIPLLHILFFSTAFNYTKVIKCQESPIESGRFKIINIDSIDRTYVIYAQKKSLVYKILSTKGTNTTKNNLLRIGKTYYLELSSLLKHESYKLHINGMKYNGVLIKIEQKVIVHDLFESRDINGRSYISKTNNSLKRRKNRQCSQ